MTAVLSVALRVAGAGLLLLAIAHVPIARQLRWREEAARLSAANAAIFHVHTLFICAMLVLMGLPALLAPELFIVPSRAGAWLAWSFAAMWGLRLYVQWFVFPQHLWRGKAFETAMHLLFTVIWSGLTALFVVCGLVQAGRLQ
ncbi:MAG: hypothetical protein MUE41_00975 [Gemmatimonadaceae bacterium]|jgi:hypothetical protein|nr:hypothetical protein [Gemmatimonadaceae bacterium]